MFALSEWTAPASCVQRDVLPETQCSCPTPQFPQNPRICWVGRDPQGSRSPAPASNELFHWQGLKFLLPGANCVPAVGNTTQSEVPGTEGWRASAGLEPFPGLSSAWPAWDSGSCPKAQVPHPQAPSVGREMLQSRGRAGSRGLCLFLPCLQLFDVTCSALPVVVLWEQIGKLCLVASAWQLTSHTAPCVLRWGRAGITRPGRSSTPRAQELLEQHWAPQRPLDSL